MDVGVAIGTASDAAAPGAPVGTVAPARRPSPWWWALIAGVVVLGLGVLAVAAVDIAGAETPGAIVHVTISQAGLTPLAPVFDVAVLAIAVGSAAVIATAVVLRRARELPWMTGALTGAIAVVGFVLVATFTKQDWSQPPAMSGSIHRVGSLLAFVALPIAVIALSRRTQVGRRLARSAIVAAIAGMASFLPIVIAILAVGASGGWWLVVPLGLIERAIALFDIAALVLLAVRCWRELRISQGSA